MSSGGIKSMFCFEDWKVLSIGIWDINLIFLLVFVQKLAFYSPGCNVLFVYTPFDRMKIDKSHNKGFIPLSRGTCGTNSDRYQSRRS